MSGSQDSLCHGSTATAAPSVPTPLRRWHHSIRGYLIMPLSIMPPSGAPRIFFVLWDQFCMGIIKGMIGESGIHLHDQPDCRLVHWTPAPSRARLGNLRRGGGGRPPWPRPWIRPWGVCPFWPAWSAEDLQWFYDSRSLFSLLQFRANQHKLPTIFHYRRANVFMTVY